MSDEDDDDLLFGFDLEFDFEDDGTKTADEELNGIKLSSGNSSNGLFFAPVHQFKSKPKRAISMSNTQPMPNEAIDIQPKSINVRFSSSRSAFPNLSPVTPRILSQFKPQKFDIVSFGATPLNIENISLKDTDTGQDSLEYIQNGLPDLHSLYYQTVFKQIRKCQKQVKCVNLRATKSNIANVMNNGGCKILQFMAHCCNPTHIDMSNADGHLYKQMIPSQIAAKDSDYVLLECDNDIMNGQWYDMTQLQQMFHSQLCDIIIVLSPNYKKMVDIFHNLGYKYIIGIKTFNENIPKQERDKNNYKITVFLTRLYSAILDGECIDRSFELAKTAASSQDINTTRLEQDVLKQMISTDTMLEEIKQSESSLNRINTIGVQNRFLLNIRENYAQKFVAFHDYISGKPIELSNINLTNYSSGEPIELKFVAFHDYISGAMELSNLTNYSSCDHLQCETPFIGRSKALIELYTAITEYQIVSCIGRKNYGRRSVIIRLMNYLQQHRYFTHGIMIVDCEQETDRYLFDDAMTDKLCTYFSHINGYAFNDILDDIKDNIPNISMCVVILNVDAWRNKCQDPREWIKQFALKMPKECKCIYTDDGDNLMKSCKKLPLTAWNSNASERLSDHTSVDEYEKYIKAMRVFFTNASTFTATNIDKLSKAKLSQLFMNVIAVNKEVTFDVSEVEQHTPLQIKWDGKARFVKRAAAWVSKLLATTEDMELNLDNIHNRLPDEWILSTPKGQMNARQMRVFHSHSISPFFNPAFQQHLSTNNLQQGYSLLLHEDKSQIRYSRSKLETTIDEEDHVAIDDNIAKIRNATEITDLLDLLREQHLPALKQLLLRDYSNFLAQPQSITNLSIKSLKNAMSLKNEYSRHSFVITPTVTPLITPPPPEMRISTPYPSNVPYPTAMPYQVSVPVVKSTYDRSKLTLNNDKYSSKLALNSANTDDYFAMMDKTIDLNPKRDSGKRHSDRLMIPMIINSNQTLPGISNNSIPGLPALDSVETIEEPLSLHIPNELMFGHASTVLFETNVNEYAAIEEEGSQDMSDDDVIHRMDTDDTTYTNYSINTVMKEKRKGIMHTNTMDSTKDAPTLQNEKSVPLDTFGHYKNTESKYFGHSKNTESQQLTLIFGKQSCVRSNSNKNRHTIGLSSTMGIIDIEAISTEDDNRHDLDHKILFEMNENLQKLWRTQCCNHNQNIMELHNLQKEFYEKLFKKITKLKGRKFNLTSLSECYLSEFGVYECETLNNALVIGIKQFEQFWDWLELLCYFICKFKKMFKIYDRKSSDISEFGMLIGKNEANTVLSKRENIKNGAFVLYINDDSLICLYRHHKYDDLKEIVIKYVKKNEYYIVDGKKNKDPITFIKKAKYLKLFYLPKKNCLIKKE